MLARPRFRRTAVTDRLDLRDRPYMPDVSLAPPPRLNSLAGVPLAPLDQGQTNACTGFALARVVDYLLHRARRRRECPVSPFMLYSMARRYDEFPGYKADEGSSLRGALKAWYKHGACSSSHWRAPAMPPANPDPAKDWWQDSARRPLGAYYRVDTRSVTDMHVALRDVGVLYASAIGHQGWDQGFGLPPKRRRGWQIPYREAADRDGGHAFAIVGYDQHGFLVLNSWGRGWGDRGLATLTYRDWLDHAMDCWVAQLGVVTDQHEAVAGALTLRTDGDKVTLARDPSLRSREIAPFIVDMENDGKLSQSGDFRTSAADLEALVTLHLGEARKRWGLATQPIDVALYAHGGLTGEGAAAETAARWIPALYDAQIFPIFLMWETDLLSTLRNRLADLVDEIRKPEARRTAGLRDQIERFWNKRLERTLSGPGSLVWGEMKQNAEAISAAPESGARLLYAIGRKTRAFEPGRVRLHLIGHSAGSIVHSHIVAKMAPLGWTFTTVNFMAPAVTCETFERTVRPQIQGGRVLAYNQFHLTDDVEQHDPTCRPILGYGRSLLFLVSESFEHGTRTPILGLERDFASFSTLPRVTAFAAPGTASASTTHGGFDDDGVTRASVIRAIGASRSPAVSSAGGLPRTATTGRRHRSRAPRH